MRQLPRTSLPSNERGATLIVALILLILISLIGATSLRSASVAEKMASADHQKNLTFQASESAALVSLRDTTLISAAMVAAAPTPITNVPINVPNATAAVVFTPVGEGAVLGSSIGSGGFSGQRILVTSTSTLTDNPNAQTITEHGVVRLVPGGAN